MGNLKTFDNTPSNITWGTAPVSHVYVGSEHVWPPTDVDEDHCPICKEYYGGVAQSFSIIAINKLNNQTLRLDGGVMYQGNPIEWKYGEYIRGNLYLTNDDFTNYHAVLTLTNVINPWDENASLYDANGVNVTQSLPYTYEFNFNGSAGHETHFHLYTKANDEPIKKDLAVCAVCDQIHPAMKGSHFMYHLFFNDAAIGDIEMNYSHSMIREDQFPNISAIIGRPGITVLDTVYGSWRLNDEYELYGGYDIIGWQDPDGTYSLGIQSRYMSLRQYYDGMYTYSYGLNINFDGSMYQFGNDGNTITIYSGLTEEELRNGKIEDETKRTHKELHLYKR